MGDLQADLCPRPRSPFLLRPPSLKPTDDAIYAESPEQIPALPVWHAHRSGSSSDGKSEAALPIWHAHHSDSSSDGKSTSTESEAALPIWHAHRSDSSSDDKSRSTDSEPTPMLALPVWHSRQSSFDKESTSLESAARRVLPIWRDHQTSFDDINIQHIQEHRPATLKKKAIHVVENMSPVMSFKFPWSRWLRKET